MGEDAIRRGRRRVLASAAAATAAGLAGCGGRFLGAEPAPTRTPPAATPGTPPDAGYPEYELEDGVVRRVIGYDAVDPAKAPLVLVPDARSAELPRATLSFTLRNRSDRTFESDFYGWRLHRFEGGSWHYVAPPGAKIIGSELGPGGTHTWDLTVSNAGLAAVDLTDGGTEAVTVRGLGAGTYAFSIDGWWAGESSDRRTVAAARFRLAGEPLGLRPSSRVTEATLSGGTVTVEAENPEAPNGPKATYGLDRVPDASDPAPVVTEWVIRSWPLRDALAYATADVEAVRVHTRTAAVSGPPFGVQPDWPPLAYDGGTFRVSSRRR